MNMFQAVNNAMDIALGADETAGNFWPSIQTSDELPRH
jgi:hypothetical protein